MSSSPVKTGHGDMSPTENVNLDVYNVRGQRVRSLVNDSYKAGIHTVVWDGTDDKAQNVTSGVYFFVMETSESRHVRKAILLK
jgi:flagellar hook assembly protein FlgD